VVLGLQGTTVWLPKDVVELVDKVKKSRRDPARSDTVRYLLLRALADMSYLSRKTKKALGVVVEKSA
jgi:metal-responsive CopG/Arc/MetJ family transcriptional regulator